MGTLNGYIPTSRRSVEGGVWERLGSAVPAGRRGPGQHILGRGGFRLDGRQVNGTEKNRAHYLPTR